MFSQKLVTLRGMQMSTMLSTRSAQFSTAAVSKESLFEQLIEEAGQIKEYNYKSYFVRRAAEDKDKMDDFSVEEL